jgi:tetratricopeptide (TPR) repeat protein
MRHRSVIVFSLAILMLACHSRSKEMKNAEIYIQVNELGKAKELLDLEIQANPKNAEAYVMLAKVFLLGGDPIDAKASFDKALLLDTNTKSEISKTYFEAAQGVAEKQGDQASSALVSAYLQEAATLDPDLKGKIVGWAIKRAKAESLVDRSTAPIALLQAAAKAAPDSRDRIADALMETAKAYLDKQFLREAAAYAMEAGQQSASKLNEASSILRSACTLLPAQDRGYARGCLEKAMQWNPALANDDDVYWLTRVGLKTNRGSGITDYLAKFPSGKHASDAKSILEEEARAPRIFTYQDGAFREESDGKWVERNPRGAYYWVLRSSDEQFLYLWDQSRSKTMRLPVSGGLAVQRDGPFNTEGPWFNFQQGSMGRQR